MGSKMSSWLRWLNFPSHGENKLLELETKNPIYEEVNLNI